MRVEQVIFPVMRNLLARPRLADAVFGLDKWGNVLGDERYSDPYSVYDRMSADGRLVWRPRFQLWFVMGYDEAKEILGSPKCGVAGQREVLLDVRPYTKLSDQAKRFFGNLLLFIDPPDHTRLRGLVARAFTPRQISRIEPAAIELAADMISALLPPEQRGAKGSTNNKPDLVPAFNAPFPINIISNLLGIPEDLWDWTADITQRIIPLFNPFVMFDVDDINVAIDEAHNVFLDLVDQRRAEPREDLLTALAQAEEDGDKLSPEELVAVASFLMAAGHETTASMLGNSMIALADFPEQRAMLRERPELWPNAIEELLRFDTSVQSDPRTALEDIEVAGQTIKKGQNILVMPGAANRDPRRYDRPDELQLDREDIRTISFGHGIHHCIGHALARMELRVGLQAFLDAFGDYTIDHDDIVWSDSLVARGPKKLLVKPG